MGNLGETKPMGNLIFNFGNNDYVLNGGGGGQPGPNTVGTEQIIDDSVELEDLNTEVKDKMTNHYDAQGEGIVLGGLVADTQSGGHGGFPNEMQEEEGD